MRHVQKKPLSINDSTSKQHMSGGNARRTIARCMYQRGGVNPPSAFVMAFITNDHRYWSVSDLTDENRANFIAWIEDTIKKIDLGYVPQLSDDTRSQLLSFLLYLTRTAEDGGLDYQFPELIDAIVKYFIAWMLKKESYQYNLRHFLTQVVSITSNLIDENSDDMLMYFIQKGGLESLAWLCHMFSMDEMSSEFKPIEDAYGHLSFLIGQKRHSGNMKGRQIYFEACSRSMDSASALWEATNAKK